MCVCVCVQACLDIATRYAFWVQVPAGDSKKELLDQLDQVPTHVQTLQFTVKEPTVGKAATFVKVDHVIRETKNLMNVINKVVTTCFECANKVSTLVMCGTDARLFEWGGRMFVRSLMRGWEEHNCNRKLISPHSHTQTLGDDSI